MSFERARREIQSQIDAFYGRYARNNAVSLSEAQKALSLAELRDFKDDPRRLPQLRSTA